LPSAPFVATSCPFVFDKQLRVGAEFPSISFPQAFLFQNLRLPLDPHPGSG
jgi:hypothetical protein